MAIKFNLLSSICSLILLTQETTAYPKANEDLKPPYTAPGGNLEKLTEESRRNVAKPRVKMTSTTIPSTTVITTSTNPDLIPTKLVEDDTQDKVESTITLDMEANSPDSADPDEVQHTDHLSVFTEAPTTTLPSLDFTGVEYNSVLDLKENDSSKPEELTEFKTDNHSEQKNNSASHRCKLASFYSLVLLFLGHFIII